MKYKKQERVEILNKIKSFMEQDKLSRREACRRIGISESTVRSWEKATVQVETDKPKYIVTKKNKVLWEAKDDKMEIDLSLLDNAFYQYSKHGLNKTAVQVQNSLGFNAIQWQSFKRTFELVKDSDVFSPYSLSLVSGKEKTDMIAEKISEKYSDANMRDVIAYESQKQQNRAYQNAIKKASGLDYKRREFETAILEYLDVSVKKVNVRVAKSKTKKHGVHEIADTHIGADIEKEHLLPAFNVDVVKARLVEVADKINAQNNEKNTICFLGDFIESFTGLNHPNSWKGIDKRYGYGTKATIMACEIITEFLEKVDNVHEVLLVAGNHDRVTSSNKEDTDGEIIYWIHYILKQRFAKAFAIDYTTDVITRVIDNICYIWTHGHLSISKRSTSDIINMYGVPGYFCVVMQGHFHCRQIKDDTINYRFLTCPSIFTGNKYSKGLGFTTMPGFITSISDGKYPTIIDHTLKLEY